MKTIIDKQLKKFVGYNNVGIVSYSDGLACTSFRTPVAVCNNCGEMFKNKEAKKMMYGHIGCPKPSGEYLINMSLKEFKKKFSTAIKEAIGETLEEVIADLTEKPGEFGWSRSFNERLLEKYKIKLKNHKEMKK